MTESVVKEIPPNTLVAFGTIGGLLGIYLTSLTYISPYFSVFGALGALCAIIWGAEAVRRISKYGLGTGVPSIGQIATGMGIVAAMFGLAVAGNLGFSVAGPIISLAMAAFIGLVIGWLAQNVLKMKIPIFVRVMTELGSAGALLLIGLSAAVAGGFDFTTIVDKVFDDGFMLAVWMTGTVAILHPYNACLGPDEKQKRLLFLGGSTGSLAVIVAGIASLLTQGMPGALIIALGAVSWVAFYKKFWDEVYKDASEVLGTGLIPKSATPQLTTISQR
jgi:tetrahydromethanopterin S-methyltransferase subunit C